jgi:hypothetical protein
MRPTTSETLLCLRRVIGEVVLPSVADEYARTQIGHALGALDDLARLAADEFVWILESNDLLVDLLADAQTAISARPAGDPIRAVEASLRAVLQDAGWKRPVYPTGAVLAERCMALRQALSDLILGLHRFGADLPEREALEARARAYLRMNVARLS